MLINYFFLHFSNRDGVLPGVLDYWYFTQCILNSKPISLVTKIFLIALHDTWVMVLLVNYK